MGRRARLGLIIALAGLLFPIVALPFTKGQVPMAGFLYNINRMEVVLYEPQKPQETITDFARRLRQKQRSEDWQERVAREFKDVQNQRRFEEERIAFPYGHCLLGGAALVFVGLAMFILSYKKEEMRDS